MELPTSQPTTSHAAPLPDNLARDSEQGPGDAPQRHPKEKHASNVARVVALCNNLPEELRATPHWVLYRIEPDPKPDDPAHTTKIPYVARKAGNLGKAKSNDAKTWRSFDEACAALRARTDVDGLGFVFSSDDPFCGVDLDHCMDPETGKLTDLAHAIIETFHTYTEYSPSGRGVHLIIRATMPDGKGRKVGGYEAYSSGRFFTVTGTPVEGAPSMVGERQDELTRFAARYLPERVATTPSAAHPVKPIDLSDQALIRRMFAAKNGSAIRELWDGGLGGKPSASEADLALCLHLHFWTQGNPDRMDTLFRQSARYSAPGRADKWDGQRGTTTYGWQTISSAMAMGGAMYDPQVNTPARTARATVPPISAGVYESGAGDDGGDDSELLQFEADDDGNAQAMHLLYGYKFLYTPAYGPLSPVSFAYNPAVEQMYPSPQIVVREAGPKAFAAALAGGTNLLVMDKRRIVGERRRAQGAFHRATQIRGERGAVPGELPFRAITAAADLNLRAGGEDRAHRHLVARQRARLVRADNGCGAERFDRRQLADDGVGGGHAADAKAQADCDDGRQRLWNGGDRERHREQEQAQDGIEIGDRAREQSGREHDRADPQHDHAEALAGAVELLLQRGRLFLRGFQQSGNAADFGLHAGCDHDCAMRVMVSGWPNSATCC